MSDPLDSGIDQLWERSRATVEQRVATVERLAAAMHAGSADEDLLRQARRDAHQLAGSLAFLGFEDASDVARVLDRMLRPEAWHGDTRAILEQADRLREALRLPRVALPDAEPAPGACAAPASARILLADDDDVIARVVQTALGLDGHTVVRVSDGDRALQAVHEQAFDLLILDLQMPGLTGLEVCRAVRAEGRTATIPIVLLTAQSDREHVEAGFASGATDYLTKPFGVAQLRTRVQAWLGKAPSA